jgi:SAM-dependent methyltransferase
MPAHEECGTGPASRDSWARIALIMRRCGATCGVNEFHEAVNVTFHDIEAGEYDESSPGMWRVVPRQFSLLVEDCLKADAVPDSIAMLDIGCGTGLAAESILRSPIGSRLRSVDLLDTSAVMLEKAEARARGWKVPVRRHNCTVEQLAGADRYDLVVVSSVLHHVPALPGFLAAIDALQPRGSLFLHVQDPNFDYFDDPELRRRMELAAGSGAPEWLKRLAPRRIMRRIVRELTGKQPQDCTSRAIRDLVRKGVTPSPLTVAELYAITDIHAVKGDGISIRAMRDWLPRHRLISQRAYGFFGDVALALPPSLQAEEDALIAAHALNGHHIGGAWVKSRE